MAGDREGVDAATARRAAHHGAVVRVPDMHGSRGRPRREEKALPTWRTCQHTYAKWPRPRPGAREQRRALRENARSLQSLSGMTALHSSEAGGACATKRVDTVWLASVASVHAAATQRHAPECRIPTRLRRFFSQTAAQRRQPGARKRQQQQQRYLTQAPTQYGSVRDTETPGARSQRSLSCRNFE